MFGFLRRLTKNWESAGFLAGYGYAARELRARPASAAHVFSALRGQDDFERGVLEALKDFREAQQNPDRK